MITEKMLQVWAAKCVANEASKANKPRMATIASFVMLAVVSKADNGLALVKVANDKREGEIKALMRAEGFVNGSAATYSKVANGLLAKLIAVHGSPIGGKDGVSQFWADWRDAMTISKREAMVTNLYLQMQSDAGGRFMDLCDCFAISCEGNKTWQAAQDAKAEKADKPKVDKLKPRITVPGSNMTQEEIDEATAYHAAQAPLSVADMLAGFALLSGPDKGAFIAGVQAMMAEQAPMKDVTPALQQISA